MITVYNFNRGARGVRIAWQCEEMGLAYTPVALPYPTPPEYRAKHAPGSVPFLEDDGGVAIGESVAIMLYLAQRYGPTPLLPAEPALMARTLQLMVMSEAGLGGMLNPLIATRFAAPEAEKRNWTTQFGETRVADALDYVQDLLGEGAYLAGEQFTLADIAITTALGIWKGALGGAIPERLAAHRDRMMERPAYQRASAAFA